MSHHKNSSRLDTHHAISARIVNVVFLLFEWKFLNTQKGEACNLTFRVVPTMFCCFLVFSSVLSSTIITNSYSVVWTYKTMMLVILMVKSMMMITIKWKQNTVLKVRWLYRHHHDQYHRDNDCGNGDDDKWHNYSERWSKCNKRCLSKYILQISWKLNVNNLLSSCTTRRNCTICKSVENYHIVQFNTHTVPVLFV